MNYQSEIEEAKEQIIKDICKIVAINSVETKSFETMPFGRGPAEALQCVLQLGREMGFKVENFDNYAGHIDLGDGEEVLGILCHADVVPVGGDWIINPFEPQVIDGKLYGRGVLDNKGPMMVCLHAMRILKDMNVPLRKKVRLIIGTNEETNWGCMDYYFNIKKVAPPDLAFAPDSEFPVTYAEKGGLQYKFTFPLKENWCIRGGNATNSVPEIAEIELPLEIYEAFREPLEQICNKSRCECQILTQENSCMLKVKGKPAHAATPEKGVNAITGLMEVIDTLGLDNELGKLARHYMQWINWDLNGKHLGIDIADEHSGKLTFNVGKIYVKEYQLVLEIDNRVPVTYPCSEVMEQLYKGLRDSLFTVEQLSETAPLLVNKDSFLVKTLMAAYQNNTGDFTSEPRASGGCTYARSMKNCVAFGALLEGQENVMHQKNEYLEVDKIGMWLRIYLEAISKLAIIEEDLWGKN